MGSDSARRYELLLLDWDGTVRDSIGTIVGCALEALAQVGFRGDADVVRSTIGLDIHESLRRWAPAANAEQLQRVGAAYRELWIHTWHARAELFSGAERCLHNLHQRGYLLAIATGKSRVGLQRDLDTLSVATRSLFVASRTADESQSKPSPAMVLSLLEEVGVQASEALVVGDSKHDLLMARNAGCRSVGVLGGAGDRTELEAHGASAVLATFSDLEAWLESGNVP